MIKLVRSTWVWLVLAAIGGCSASEAATDRGAPRAGGAASFAAGAASRAGTAAPLAPIAPANGSSTRAASAPNTCASASVRASRITPTVYLVIDGSSSMDASFGGQGTRWEVLREAFVGQNGVVTKLESVVHFGMSIYSNNDPRMCPAMVDVQPAIKNFMAIDAAYPAEETGGGTPTGEALQKVVNSLPDFTMVAPDAVPTVPPVIVLATDGEPNGCAEGIACDWVDWANCLTKLLGSLANAAPTYETTLAAVRAAQAKGIAVWVVSLANGLNAIPDLQRTANIGAGLAEDATPGAMIYSPQNPDELVTTLSTLIGGVVSCEVALEGTVVVDRACEGEVTMNGQALQCNGDQGWRAIDENRIELLGSACARFKSDPSVFLDAHFPCGVLLQ